MNIERESSITFLGVMLGNNLSWRDHTNKIKTKIRLLYKASYINSEGLKHLYFADVHNYLNYANMEWTSTPQPKSIIL